MYTVGTYVIIPIRQNFHQSTRRILVNLIYYSFSLRSFGIICKVSSEILFCGCFSYFSRIFNFTLVIVWIYSSLQYLLTFLLGFKKNLNQNYCILENVVYIILQLKSDFSCMYTCEWSLPLLTALPISFKIPTLNFLQNYPNIPIKKYIFIFYKYFTQKQIDN